MKKTDTSDSKNPDQIKFEIPWSRSKEEIWQQVFAQLPEAGEPVKKSIGIQSWFYYSAVAVVAIVVLLFSGMWFYSETVITPIASQQKVTLPDGSSVLMNAESKLSYKPYWWYIQRQVKLDGEAYFQVKKGKRFTVISKDATTSVLGTSFNIYARNDGYEATCLTGKVKVATRHGGKTVILTPNLQATLMNGYWEKRDVDASHSIAWSRHEFFFTSAPLSKVLQEIARQYGVEIICKGRFDEQYTGNFSKELSVKEVLSLVCLPFGVNFTAINNNQYLISE